MAELSVPQALLLRRFTASENHWHPKPTSCGACGASWEVSAGEAGASGPQPGAFCICLRCAAINQYRDDLSGERVSKKELRSLPRSFRRTLLDLQESVRVRVAARRRL